MVTLDNISLPLAISILSQLGLHPFADWRDRASMGKQIEAPWTEDQVRSLNEYQASGCMHPFTCHCRGSLVAQTDGWKCPSTCDWKQTWCWDWMADWSWKSMEDFQQRLKAQVPPELWRTLHGETASEE